MESYRSRIAVTHPNIQGELSLRLGDIWKLKSGMSPGWLFRSFVSSPRMFDLAVRNLQCEGYVKVGDSFLDAHTMLADCPQKTYAITLSEWERVSTSLEVVEEFHFRDASVSRLQVWAVDPKVLSFEALRIAVAVSFTDLELADEPRLSGALTELMSDYKIEFDRGEK